MSVINFKSIKLTLDYLRHYISAGDEHSVHSPFVFKLLTEGIYRKEREAPFDTIESIRKKLLNDQRTITITDLGAGSTFDGIPQKRKVSEIARNFAKSPGYSKLLFRLTQFFKPGSMIELGTSLGISAMYQSAGNNNVSLYTLEGCPNTASVAREIFKENNFRNIKCIIGNFDETLPELLKKIEKADYVFIDGNHTYEATMRYFRLLKNYIHENSILIFDDINWSDGMKKAWSEIKSDPEVTITIDFFLVGLVFFSKNYTKQNFMLRING